MGTVDLVGADHMGVDPAVADVSGGDACRDVTHRPYWYVTDRWCNHSAFNGYRWTPSDYSSVNCPLCPARTCHWRTKARYVDQLPDEIAAVVPSKSRELAIPCPHTSWSGGERPIGEMGRWPVLWICDSCGTAEIMIEQKEAA